MEAFNQLKLGRTGVKYIIFKIVNDKEIVVADQSKEKDFDIFQKEMTKSDDGGAVDPKYAVYDCEYELPGGDGKRSKIVLMSLIPDELPPMKKMKYSTSFDALKNTFSGIGKPWQLNDKEDLTWANILAHVKG